MAKIRFESRQYLSRLTSVWRSYLAYSATLQSSLSLGRASTSGHSQTELGPKIFLLSQAALPGSNAGSDGVQPASGFVIQNRQTSYSMWFSSVQFSRFLFSPLVEQNTYINVISLPKKGHPTKRNNVVTCKNPINYISKGNGLHGCIT